MLAALGMSSYEEAMQVLAADLAEEEAARAAEEEPEASDAEGNEES